MKEEDLKDDGKEFKYNSINPRLLSRSFKQKKTNSLPHFIQMNLISVTVNDEPILDLSQKNICEISPMDCFKILKNYPKINTLNLSFNKFEKLVNDLSIINTLNTLNLSTNLLKKIPKCVFEFEHLTELKISHNKIQFINPEISRLQKLEILDVSFNLITDIPNEINKIQKLKEFNLTGNPLVKELENIADNLPKIFEYCLMMQDQSSGNRKLMKQKTKEYIKSQNLEGLNLPKNMKKKEKAIAEIITALLAPPTTAKLWEKYTHDLLKELSRISSSLNVKRLSTNFFKETNVSLENFLLLNGQNVLETSFVKTEVPQTAINNMVACYLIILEHKKHTVTLNNHATNKFFTILTDKMIKSTDPSFRFNCITIFANIAKKAKEIPSFFFEDIELLSFFMKLFRGNQSDERHKSLLLECILLVKTYSKDKNKINQFLKIESFNDLILTLIEKPVGVSIQNSLRTIQSEKLKEVLSVETSIPFKNDPNSEEMQLWWKTYYGDKIYSEKNENERWREMGFISDKDNVITDLIRNKMHFNDIIHFFTLHRDVWCELVRVSSNNKEGRFRIPIFDAAVVLSDELNKNLMDTTVSKYSVFLFKTDFLKGRRTMYCHVLRQIFHMLITALVVNEELIIYPPKVISWTEKTVQKFLSFNFNKLQNIENYTLYFLNKTPISEKKKFLSKSISFQDKKLKRGSILFSSFSPLVSDHEVKFQNVYKKEIDSEIGIPVFIAKILSILQTEGIKREGIFRVSPENKKIENVESQLNNNPYQLDSIDPHICSAILKRWLQCLDPPLCGDNHKYEKIVNFIKNEQFSDLNKLIFNMPRKNKIVLKSLISTLKEFLDENVIQNTKMDSKNIAVIFAPTILNNSLSNPNQSLANSNFERDFILYLLLIFNLEVIDL